jgi:hypothetical protein
MNGDPHDPGNWRDGEPPPPVTDDIDDGMCKSCVDGKCVTGPECVTLGRDGPLQNGDKDWTTPCLVCGRSPTLYPTGLCGPCCTGSAETAGGNW